MKKTYEHILEEYRNTYDIETLTTPNDRHNLDLLIRNQMLLSALNEQLTLYIDEGVSDNLQPIDRIQDTIRKTTDQSLAIERALGIDRKSRKKDNTEDVGAYITFIKNEALEFLERQLIYVYCPKCKVMCARILPAHEHTEFDVKVQCSQCGKYATAKRAERDVMFDIRDREWRKKHPIEIIHPKEIANENDITVLEDSEDSGNGT